MQASMKLGATALPSPTRRSVSASASLTNLSRGLPSGAWAPVQAVLLQLGQAVERVAGLQQLDHLVEHARGRHVGQQRRHRLQGLERLGLDREAELGREAHHADDADGVFAVARLGVADHAQRLGLGVLDAVVVVDDDLVARVVVHRVDGEVAPRRILDLRAPDVVAQHAAARVDHMALAGHLVLRGLLVAADLLGGRSIHVGPEGRDLDHLVVTAAAVDHVHDAEAPADDEGAAEQRLDLLGRRVRRHVEVFRTPADQQVAHSPADDEGLVAGILQGGDDADRPLVEQGRVDAVLGGRHLGPLAQRDPRPLGGGLVAGGGLAQQLVDEFADHG
jgi:hypothetical protein